MTEVVRTCPHSVLERCYIHLLSELAQLSLVVPGWRFLRLVELSASMMLLGRRVTAFHWTINRSMRQ